MLCLWHGYSSSIWIITSSKSIFIIGSLCLRARYSVSSSIQSFIHSCVHCRIHHSPFESVLAVLDTFAYMYLWICVLYTPYVDTWRCRTDKMANYFIFRLILTWYAFQLFFRFLFPWSSYLPSGCVHVDLST